MIESTRTNVHNSTSDIYELRFPQSTGNANYLSIISGCQLIMPAPKVTYIFPQQIQQQLSR